MRRASLTFLLLLLAALAPAAAQATHLEVPELDTNCNDFTVSFRANYRSSVIEADLQLVVTMTDENGEELLRFTYETPLLYDGDKYENFTYTWLWNDVTDDIIQLGGTVTVHAEMTVTAPWGDLGLVDVHTVEAEAQMACDVVDNEHPTWGELKSRYR